MTVQIICEGACNNYAVEGIDHDLFEAQTSRGHGTGVTGDEGLWERIRLLKYTEHIQLTARHFRCVVCQKVRIFGWSEMGGAHGDRELLGPDTDVASGTVAAARELTAGEAADALVESANRLLASALPAFEEPPPLRMHDVVKKARRASW